VNTNIKLQPSNSSKTRIHSENRLPSKPKEQNWIQLNKINNKNKILSDNQWKSLRLKGKAKALMFMSNSSSATQALKVNASFNQILFKRPEVGKFDKREIWIVI
jgi:hypothetical protein